MIDSLLQPQSHNSFCFVHYMYVPYGNDIAEFSPIATIMILVSSLISEWTLRKQATERRKAEKEGRKRVNEDASREGSI